MFWKLASWLLARLGVNLVPGDEMDSAPEPDGDDSVHAEEVHRGVSR